MKLFQEFPFQCFCWAASFVFYFNLGGLAQDRKDVMLWKRVLQHQIALLRSVLERGCQKSRTKLVWIFSLIMWVLARKEILEPPSYKSLSFCKQKHFFHNSRLYFGKKFLIAPKCVGLFSFTLIAEEWWKKYQSILREVSSFFSMLK